MSRIIADPKTEIGIKNFPAGIYFLRLIGEKKVLTGKFVRR
jgi:hypothetical protein